MVRHRDSLQAFIKRFLDNIFRFYLLVGEAFGSRSMQMKIQLLKCETGSVNCLRCFHTYNSPQNVRRNMD